MKTKTLAFLCILPILLFPLFSFAQDPADTDASDPADTSTQVDYPVQRITIPNPLRSDIDSLPKLIAVIIDELVTPIAAVVVVLMIMYAGFLFVTAQGNPAQISKAKDSLLYGSIGAGIVLGAKVLAFAIKNTVDKLQ